MERHNIKPSDKLICFGQLLGMCDQVSFPLGEYVVGLEKYCIFFNMFVTTGIISLYLTKYNDVAFSGLNPQNPRWWNKGCTLNEGRVLFKIQEA